jgi:hypothetical protein
MGTINLITAFGTFIKMPRKKTIDEVREWCERYILDADDDDDDVNEWTHNFCFEHDDEECDGLIAEDINELTIYIKPNTLEQNLAKADLLATACCGTNIAVEEMDDVERRVMLFNYLDIYNGLFKPTEEQIRLWKLDFENESDYMSSPLYPKIREWEISHECKLIERFVRCSRRTLTN